LPALLFGVLFLLTFFLPICAQDSVTVWVMFRDKPRYSNPLFPAHCLERRKRAGRTALSDGDYPVSTAYVQSVRALGARCRETVKWVNAASFTMPRSCLVAVNELSFVKEVRPVGRYRKVVPATPKAPAKRRDQPSFYGQSFGQLDTVSVPDAQHYLTDYLGVEPGTGIVVAVFDAGFVTDHACLAYLRDNHRIIADSDYVGGGIAVRDADGGSHGEQTLSLIAGYAPGVFMGTAWNARFVLARTENDYAEEHIEEDHWAAAAVWAESLGVDIISSSLGYRTGFTDSLGDIPYSQLDGKSTVISLAADSACSRGVIVVNAAGNDGSNYPTPEFSTLDAPADAEEVVTVGAVLPQLIIADFSSCGPTADGRMKPDLVAQGVSVMVPNPLPQQTGSYDYDAAGTSFSTPVVAGLLALVLQAHPGPADSVKQRLYNTCRLTPYQTGRDNVYGRGVPDGLLACLGDNQAYIVARDSNATPIPGTIIRAVNGDSLGRTDSLGTALLTLKSGSLPLAVKGLAPSGETQLFTVTATPSRSTVFFGLVRKIAVSVTDTAGRAISNPDVFWRTFSAPAFTKSVANDSGAVLITYPTMESCRLYATARGYRPSDTITVSGTDAVVAVTIALTPQTSPSFVVYPNVVSLAASAPVMHFQFIPGSDATVGVNEPMRILVRSATGLEVWHQSMFVDPYRPQLIDFKCANAAGKKLVPGMYFVIVVYGDAQYTKRFLITG
jgi:serine protease AprX